MVGVMRASGTGNKNDKDALLEAVKGVQFRKSPTIGPEDSHRDGGRLDRCRRFRRKGRPVASAAGHRGERKMNAEGPGLPAKEGLAACPVAPSVTSLKVEMNR